MAKDLADLMANAMLEEPALRKKFLALVAKPKAIDASMKAYASLWGWTPSDEIREYERVYPAYRKYFETISDVWMLAPAIAHAEKLAKKLTMAKLLPDVEFMTTLVCGLELLGHDPSGDRSFISTLPGTTADVFVYSHESGELDSSYPSFASFVMAAWGEGERAPKRKAKAAHEDPEQLFARAHWMFGVWADELPWEFARKLDAAPTFATWQKEKSLCAKHPVLLHYWTVAHVLLGNAKACAECVEIGKKSKAAITRALADAAAAFLKTPTKPFAGFNPKVFAGLRAAIEKNAPATLFEEKKKGAAPAAKSAVKFASEDVWQAAIDHPEDIAGHDRALNDLAKTKGALADEIKAYQKARTEDLYDKWPYGKQTLHKRWSGIASAAFRSGLQYNSDHPKAFGALANTLAYFDDDNAMNGFADAVERLAADDGRLEYVADAIEESKHPRAAAIRERAAWRFFELFDAAVSSTEKVKKRGPTLDDIFRVHSYYQRPLCAALRLGGELAEKLADKTLSYHKHLGVLGPALALSMRVAAEQKLDRHLQFARAYCGMVHNIGDTSDAFLQSNDQMNFSEAAHAFARLAPEEALPALTKMLDKPRESHMLRMDVIGGALAGLLVLRPDDKELLVWTERVLGNRTSAMRVYGAVRGVGEGRITAAIPWVKAHVYNDMGSIMLSQEDASVARAARETLAKLGVEMPPADLSDEYANKVKKSDLVAALATKHRHHAEHVLERMWKEKELGPAVLAAASAHLHDSYAFSVDDSDRADDRSRTEALRVLITHGEQAAPALASLVALPHIGPGDKTIVLYVMRMAIPEKVTRDFLANASDADVAKAIRERSPRTLGHLDFLCAHLAAGDEKAAMPIVEEALRWRAAQTSGWATWDDEEPILVRLALLAAHIGLKNVVKELAKKAGEGSSHDVLEAALASKGPQFAEGDDLVLVQSIKRHGGEPLHTLALSAKGTTFDWSSTVVGVHCQGIIDFRDYKLESYGSLPSLGRTARAACLLGMHVKEKEKPKKKGKR